MSKKKSATKPQPEAKYPQAQTTARERALDDNRAETLEDLVKGRPQETMRLLRLKI